METLGVCTELGSFRILLETAAADTCAYFVAAAQSGVFDDGRIFRIVSRQQPKDADACPIDVVQLGTRRGLSEQRDVIRHEHSGVTQLHHRRWVVSAARYRPGELYHSFFVCLQDEPELDFGGNRHADGQGFAAFGRIVEGFDAVSKAFHHAEQSDQLSKPILVNGVQYFSS